LAATRPGRARSPADLAKQARSGLNNGLAKPSRHKTIEIHPFIRRILMEAAAKVYDAVLFEIRPEIQHRTADRNLTSIDEPLAVFCARARPTAGRRARLAIADPAGKGRIKMGAGLFCDGVRSDMQ